MCFFGQLRAGEVFPTSSNNPSDYDFAWLPAVKDLRPANKSGDRKLHLPKTKVSQLQGETVILTTQLGGVSPTRALHEHICINHLRPDDPLLAYRDENNDLKVLSKMCFLKRCNNIWSTLGIPKMTGHCFCIGGTTHFLIAGVPPDIVKALGRWKSDTILRYWRDLDSLASVYLHQLHTQCSYADQLNNHRIRTSGWRLPPFLILLIPHKISLWYMLNNPTHCTLLICLHISYLQSYLPPTYIVLLPSPL